MEVENIFEALTPGWKAAGENELWDLVIMELVDRYSFVIEVGVPLGATYEWFQELIEAFEFLIGIAFYRLGVRGELKGAAGMRVSKGEDGEVIITALSEGDVAMIEKEIDQPRMQ